MTSQCVRRLSASSKGVWAQLWLLSADARKVKHPVNNHLIHFMNTYVALAAPCFFVRHGAPGVRSSLASHQCSLKIFSSFQRRAQNHSAFSGCSYSPPPQAFHLSSVAASTIHSHSVTLLLTAIWAYPNTVQLTKVPPKACNFCGCGDMLVPLPSPSNTTHPLDSVTHTSPKKEGRG